MVAVMEGARMDAAEKPSVETLMEQYRPHALRVARRAWRLLPRRIPWDDIEAAAMEGLWRAAVKWEPEKGRFLTFMPWKVRSAIGDWMRRQDHAPRLMRQRGEAPVQQSLDASLFSGNGRANSRYRNVSRGRAVALGETIPDPRPPLVRSLAARDLIRRACEFLSPVERQVLLCYWLDGLTLAEIGLSLGLSGSRISQMHAAILETLRRASLRFWEEGYEV